VRCHRDLFVSRLEFYFVVLANWSSVLDLYKRFGDVSCDVFEHPVLERILLEATMLPKLPDRLRVAGAALFLEPRRGAFKLRARPDLLAGLFLDVLFAEAAKPAFVGYTRQSLETLLQLFLYGMIDLPRQRV
jgi:hypothetical protein